MRRYYLFVCLTCVLTAGCVSPTGDPPPYSQPTFEYESTSENGTTILNITVVDPSGLTSEPVRILVEDHVAYANGSLRPPYNASAAYENEWEDGLKAGDYIRVTNGSTLDPGTEVHIELRRSDTGEFVAVGGTEVGAEEEY